MQRPEHKRPVVRPHEWLYVGRIPSGYGQAFTYKGPDKLLVISEGTIAVLPDGNGEGAQWMISISVDGGRPRRHQVRRALKAFDMLGAEEDNHHPGVARHFWMVCDPARRVACECKEDEETIREPDGYTWTNPKPETGEGCRGCELERLTGKRCTLHGGDAP